MTKKLKKRVKNSKVDIKVKNEGLLEVPEGKKVNELPLKHFEELVDKKGYDKIIKALNNLQVWNKNDDKELSNWAEDTMKKLKKKFRPEEVEGSAKASDEKISHPLKKDTRVKIDLDNGYAVWTVKRHRVRHDHGSDQDYYQYTLVKENGTVINDVNEKYIIEVLKETEDETSAKNPARDIWKEIVNKYAEYLVPEVWAGLHTRSGRILTTYTPIEELRDSEGYNELKEEFNSLDKLPKSFVNKVYSLYENFEDEEGLQELENFKTDLEAFKKFISEFGGYLFASRDSFDDWLSNLRYRTWKNSPEQLERDKKLKEAKEKALSNAKFQEGDLVVLKDKNKVFKIKYLTIDYDIDDNDFEDVTLEYRLAYPQSGREYYPTVTEDEIELYKDEDSSKSILSTKERLKKAMKKIKISASDEKITELVNKYAPHNRGWKWESNHKAITVYFKDVHSSYAEDEWDDLLKALYPKYLDDVMVANSAKEVEGKPKFEPNDKVYIKNYQGQTFTIDYYDAKTETYKLKELGFSRYSEDELEAVETSNKLRERLQNAMKKIKNSATEELTKVPSKTKVGKLLDSLFPSCDIEMRFPSKTKFDKDVIKENLDKNKKHEYLAQSSKRKVNNSKRYELFDKYDGEYCYTTYDSSLLFDAQREWDDFKEQGEYVAVPRPKTKEAAYEFFKSIYDIDVWTDEEWKKHCEEVGIENCSKNKVKNSKRYSFYDKFSGKYLYDIETVDNDSALVKEAQNEWNEHNNRGEYMNYDYPETIDEAYDYLKSLYNIDIENCTKKTKISNSYFKVGDKVEIVDGISEDNNIYTISGINEDEYGYKKIIVKDKNGHILDEEFFETELVKVED